MQYLQRDVDQLKGSPIRIHSFNPGVVLTSGTKSVLDFKMSMPLSMMKRLCHVVLLCGLPALRLPSSRDDSLCRIAMSKSWSRWNLSLRRIRSSAQFHWWFGMVEDVDRETIQYLPWYESRKFAFALSSIYITCITRQFHIHSTSLLSPLSINGVIWSPRKCCLQ